MGAQAIDSKFGDLEFLMWFNKKYILKIRYNHVLIQELNNFLQQHFQKYFVHKKLFLAQ